MNIFHSKAYAYTFFFFNFGYYGIFFPVLQTYIYIWKKRYDRYSADYNIKYNIVHTWCLSKTIRSFFETVILYVIIYIYI